MLQCVLSPPPPPKTPNQMRSLEKRQYEIEQGLRDPSELLGVKSKPDGEDGEEEEESEAAKTARAENLTKTAMAAANKLLKSTDPVERMKGTAMMTSAKLGLAVPRPEPGEEGAAKALTPQEALKQATVIALRYFSADGQVRGICWCLVLLILVLLLVLMSLLLVVLFWVGIVLDFVDFSIVFCCWYCLTVSAVRRWCGSFCSAACVVRRAVESGCSVNIDMIQRYGSDMERHYSCYWCRLLLCGAWCGCAVP